MKFCLQGMGFVIKKIVVHSESTRVRGGEAHYNMVRDKWDVRNLLEVSFIILFFSLLYNMNGNNKTVVAWWLACWWCRWQVFSREYSHKDFCLAHLFTDLKFEGGILGLAYVGSPRRNSVGGICTPGPPFYSILHHLSMIRLTGMGERLMCCRHLKF